MNRDRMIDIITTRLLDERVTRNDMAARSMAARIVIDLAPAICDERRDAQADVLTDMVVVFPQATPWAAGYHYALDNPVGGGVR